MIYDEGFEISFDSKKFMAFNKYFKTSSNWKSDCGKTLAGWYTSFGTGERACFIGVKTDSSAAD